MKDNGIKILVVIAVLIIAAVAVYYISARASASNSQKGYQSGGGKSFWDSLWNNAANIVDAGGRHTSATVTATGNAISSIIATSQTGDGRGVLAQYGYSNDDKQNYGPYVLGGALILTAGVVGAIILSKN
jgi:hypothetical protein